MQAENTHKTLIRKYIHNDCTPAELESIKELMKLPQAQRLFDEVLNESWSGFEAELDLDQPRLNHKLQEFYNRLQKDETEQAQAEISKGFFKKRTYLRFAAVLSAAILSLGTYGLLQLKKTPSREQLAIHEIANPMGQQSRIVLPDSSEVFLGAGSKLKFPERFTSKTREISLEGEAFFQVTKNPHKPFIIHTGTVQTKVLGTSFRIEAFRGLPLTVSVATGKVRVDDYKGVEVHSLAILLPGQRVSYDSGKTRQGTVDVEEVKGWKDGHLVFRGASLREITNTLERWYNVKFDYGDSGKSKEKISVLLQANVPLAKIMKVLGATGHFKYKIDTNHVRIH
jgi:transmembrane sensor